MSEGTPDEVPADRHPGGAAPSDEGAGRRVGDDRAAGDGARHVAGSAAGGSSVSGGSGMAGAAGGAGAGDGEADGGGAGDGAAKEVHGRRRKTPLHRELPVLILIAFGLALVIKAFLVQAFFIPSGSMERTLLVKDRVLVNKLIYRFRDVHRGEIIVFNGDGTDFQEPESFVEPPSNLLERGLRNLQSLLGLGAPNEKDFIKRVIGVEGDTVACCDPQGRVTVNGVPLNEPYVYENSPLESRTFGPVTVPEDRLWVMGDHRSASADSRSHIDEPGGGFVPEDAVIGRAFVRVWPLSRLGRLTVPETFSRVQSVAPAVALPVLLVERRRRRRDVAA